MASPLEIAGLIVALLLAAFVGWLVWIGCPPEEITFGFIGVLATSLPMTMPLWFPLLWHRRRTDGGSRPFAVILALLTVMLAFGALAGEYRTGVWSTYGVAFGIGAALGYFSGSIIQIAAWIEKKPQ